MKAFRSMRLFLFALLLSIVPMSSHASAFISITIAPPVLPVYDQPPCPYDGYIWTPGYWAYDNPDVGYYWVPGAWVPAPQPGFLWTPPYWGWEGGNYLFHAGYWGPHIGYYGGVNYGFGYMGTGFAGGEWRGGHFFYNTAIVHVGGGFHNVYVNETIVHQTTIVNERRVAYSGGPGGIRHDPTPTERTAMNERHIAPTSVQQQHISAAARDPQQRFNANHGRPATVAAARPMTAPAHTEAGNRGAERGGEGGRPAAGARPETRNAPQTRTESRPGNESRPATEPRTAPRAATESRPAPQTHPESRPAPQTHAESRPAPQSHTEPRPAPQTHTESRPAPQSHPAPQTHAAPQSHPAPQSRPAPKSGGEKPRGR